MNSGLYLLAESGSSKTEWFLFSRDGIQSSFETAGINPDVQQDDLILATLQNELLPALKGQVPEKMHYYGAGLRNPSNRERMERLFFTLFGKIEIEAEHDLLGAARALFGKEPGIACIIGTGSNSAHFDGKEIVEERGGNGFLFGDEASGADLGKALIKKALDEELPAELIAGMEKFAEKSLLDIRRSVHLSQKLNVALAFWTPFIHTHIENPAVHEILMERFDIFIQKTILKYKDYSHIKIGFVGSVAFYFKNELTEACKKFGIIADPILQKPGTDLVQYHIENDN